MQRQQVRLPPRPANQKTMQLKSSRRCRTSLSTRQVPKTTDTWPSGKRESYLSRKVEQAIRTHSDGWPPKVKDPTDHSSETVKSRVPRNNKPNNLAGIQVAFRYHSVAGYASPQRRIVEEGRIHKEPRDTSRFDTTDMSKRSTVKIEGLHAADFAQRPTFVGGRWVV